MQNSWTVSDGKPARLQRAKDEHPPPHQGPRPQRELANADIVPGSVKAKLAAGPRAPAHARGHLEHEAQRAERGRFKSDLAPEWSDVPRDINVCPWNRARRLSRYIQLITKTDNDSPGVLQEVCACPWFITFGFQRKTLPSVVSCVRFSLSQGRSRRFAPSPSPASEIPNVFLSASQDKMLDMVFLSSTFVTPVSLDLNRLTWTSDTTFFPRSSQPKMNKAPVQPPTACKAYPMQ